MLNRIRNKMNVVMDEQTDHVWTHSLYEKEEKHWDICDAVYFSLNDKLGIYENYFLANFLAD